MAEEKTYTGGCHCKKVRFEVDLSLEGLATCNCSICWKTGWMMAFVPAEKFRLLEGRDALTDYQFNKKHIHHKFCSTCGIRACANGAGRDGKEMYSVNVRCLDDADISGIPVKEYDGKSL
jgi:hypothetical protein